MTEPPVRSVPLTGLRRELKTRHIQMIAIGGAIGSGLFYGSANAIEAAGPGVLLAFAIGGLVIFLAMRALGEMAVDTPVSGSFSFYAYRNVGPFAGFFSGWNYWFNFIAVSMADLTVVGLYVQFWFPQVPAWVTAAVFLVVITAINLIGVGLYGELEFWFAIIKVIAIVAMIVLGFVMILTGFGNGGVPIGLDNLTAHGGFLPNGWWGVVACLAIVMFSFGGVELVGITAGEADQPSRSIPRAINQVLLRILIFYVGALFVILTIFPWNQIGQSGSPFVVVFDKVGIPAAAAILNAVVLTAAASAYNSGLYSEGRMLYALSKQRNAPAFLGRTNAKGAPYVGILVSSAVTALAVVLSFLFGDVVFNWMLSISAIACVFNWGLIAYTQIRFRRRIGPAGVRGLRFPMPLYPFGNVLVFAFLVVVVIMMTTLDDYRQAVVIGPLWLLILVIAYATKVRIAKRHGTHRPPSEADLAAQEDSARRPAADEPKPQAREGR